MNTDPIAIIAPAPPRKLRFASAKEALAYYDAVGVKTYEDLIVLAELVHKEFDKIHAIMDGVIAQLEADAAAEQAATEHGRLAESG